MRAFGSEVMVDWHPLRMQLSGQPVLDLHARRQANDGIWVPIQRSLRSVEHTLRTEFYQ